MTAASATKQGTSNKVTALPCWGAGDSITDAYWVPHDGNATWGVLSAALSGVGWIVTNLGYTIQTTYDYARTNAGADPKTLVIMGGVNDIRFGGYTPDQLKPLIRSFTAARIADGIRVYHATQPYWTHVYTNSTHNGYLASLNAWLIQTYPDTIDVAGYLGIVSADSTDGLHPNYTGTLASQRIAAYIRTALNA